MSNIIQDLPLPLEQANKSKTVAIVTMIDKGYYTIQQLLVFYIVPYKWDIMSRVMTA